VNITEASKIDNTASATWMRPSTYEYIWEYEWHAKWEIGWDNLLLKGKLSYGKSSNMALKFMEDKNETEPAKVFELEKQRLCR
jgi:hypothetical protein